MKKRIVGILVIALCTVNSFAQNSILAYAWLAYDPIGTLVEGPISITLPEAGLTQISGSTLPYFTGADFVADQWYGADSEPNSSIYTINKTTGATNLIGASGVSLKSLAYDVTNGVLYGNSYDQGSNYLYTIDIATGQATLVGSIGDNLTTPLIVSIAINNEGEIFGLDIYNNNLLSIDKSTGATTIIGSIGLTLNYDQDLAYDRDNDILYGTLYTLEGVLAEINTITGAATTLATFPQEITGFAIPYDYTAHVSTINSLSSATLFPNPCSDELHIELGKSGTTQKIEITAANGQVVYTGTISEKTCIPIKHFENGVYTITFENGENQTFIKQ